MATKLLAELLDQVLGLANRQAESEDPLPLPLPLPLDRHQELPIAPPAVTFDLGRQPARHAVTELHLLGDPARGRARPGVNDHGQDRGRGHRWRDPGQRGRGAQAGQLGDSAAEGGRLSAAQAPDNPPPGWSTMRSGSSPIMSAACPGCAAAGHVRGAPPRAARGRPGPADGRCVPPGGRCVPPGPGPRRTSRGARRAARPARRLLAAQPAVFDAGLQPGYGPLLEMDRTGRPRSSRQ